MMKKFFLAIMLAVVSLGANAQFAKGTKYISTSLSAFDISYRKNNFQLGLDATAGYFTADAWMVYGRFGFGYENQKGPDNDINKFNLGAGARYYIMQNGLYLGMGLKIDHSKFGSTARNYVDLTPEVGYCFYLNHYVSIEPAVYYDLCLNKYSEGSRVGLRLGFGYYF